MQDVFRRWQPIGLLGLLITLLFTIGAPQPAQAASQKLNRAQTSDALVFEQVQISPDSTRVLAVATEPGGARRLYSAALGGGALTQLDASPLAGGDVLEFWISPDSSTVVYRVADDRRAAVAGQAATILYAAPIAGGSPVRLDAGLGDEASVSPIVRISPDSRRTVYVTTSLGPEQVPLALYSVALSGGTPSLLASSGDEGGPIQDAQISPDGTTVVYHSGTLLPDARRIYRVPIEGGPPARLSQALSVIGTVVSFKISPNGLQLVYLSQKEDSSGPLRTLYSVPLAGGPPARLSASFHSANDTPADYRISSDSSRVVYSTKPNSDLWAQGAEAPPAVQLLSAPISGGGSLTLTGETKIWGEFVITPDGSAAIYRGNYGLAGTALYRAPLSGGPPVVLNAPSAEGGSVLDVQLSGNGAQAVFRATSPRSLDPGLYAVTLATGTLTTLAPAVDRRAPVQISLDGTRVVYVVGPSGAQPGGIFSVPIGGGTPTRLSEPLAAGTQARYQISPDGSSAIYAITTPSQASSRARAAREGFGYALFSVPLAGGQPARFVGQADASAVNSFGVSANGRVVVFAAGLPNGSASGHFGRPVFSGAPSALGAGLPEGASIRDFRLSEDGSQLVVRLARPNTKRARDELYGLASGASAVALHAGLPEGAGVTAYQLSADGSRVVFSAAQPGGDAAQLYSIAAAGGELAMLSAALPLAQELSAFQLSPDGRRVLIVAAQVEGGSRDLYSTATQGGELRKLNEGALADGTPVFSPDSSRVVFRAAGDGGAGLYVAALDGGAPSLLAALGSPCGPVLISQDSNSVVYQASQGGRCGLYQVALSGGEPVDLSAALPSEAQVAHTRLSADGQHAVFLAQESAGGAFGLYSVPLAGGSVVKLNANLRLRDTSLRARYQLSADGRLVVFEASSAAGAPFNLYRVLIEGGEPTQLNGTLVSVPIGRFELSADGRRVVYLASQDSPGVTELYSAPLSGGASLKLNGTLVAGGDVSSFALASDGGHLVYLADQEQDGVDELFVADFGPPELLLADYGLDGALDTLTVSARLATPSVLTSTIDYSVVRSSADGVARSVVANGRLEFAPGETSTASALGVTTKWIPMRDEEVVVVLGNATNATLAGPVRLALPLKDRGRYLPLLMR